jgi:glyoxylase-like metal-dependent hydrolase (beta-lactamase superfamily II)
LHIAPEQGTDVVLTHLHFDHCGCATGYNEEDHSLYAAFLHAKHWVSRSQWENSLHPHPLEQDSYFPENMSLIEQSGLLHLIDEDMQLFPGLELQIYNGHSPGQLVAIIKSDEQSYVFAGDVIPLAANISPAWISAYDLQPQVSYDEKLRLLDKAVKEKLAVIYCHDAYTPCSTVKKVNGLYKKDCIVDLK